MGFFIVSKKSLGQNFLIDKNIINKIVKIENIEKNHTILEIGAGYGNLTQAIADMNPQKIYAIEKDRKLSVHLEKSSRVISKSFKYSAKYCSGIFPSNSLTNSIPFSLVILFFLISIHT